MPDQFSCEDQVPGSGTERTYVDLYRRSTEHVAGAEVGPDVPGYAPTVQFVVKDVVCLSA